jgi:hypothetical protein
LLFCLSILGHQDAIAQKPDFATQVQTALKILRGLPVGQELLSRLDQTLPAHIAYKAFTATMAEKMSDDDFGTVAFNFISKQWEVWLRPDVAPRDMANALGHEIFHILDYQTVVNQLPGREKTYIQLIKSSRATAIECFSQNPPQKCSSPDTRRILEFAVGYYFIIEHRAWSRFSLPAQAQGLKAPTWPTVNNLPLTPANLSDYLSVSYVFEMFKILLAPHAVAESVKKSKAEPDMVWLFRIYFPELFSVRPAR